MLIWTKLRRKIILQTIMMIGIPLLLILILFRLLPDNLEPATFYKCVNPAYLNENR